MRLWYRLLDWLLYLPPELDRAMWAELARIAQEKTVTFVPYLEREAMKQGQEQEARQALEVVIKARFPNEADAFLPEISGLTDLDKLRQCLHVAAAANSLEELRPLLS